MDFVIDLIVKYPTVGTIIVILGSLRMVFKPIFAAVENYTASTESLEDDKAVAKFKSGKVYKVIAFVLDYAASIKLKK